MQYKVEIKRQAEREMRRLPETEAIRILDALLKLQDNLAGDVKRLTNFAPEYRLRVGNYRVLFEIEDGDRIVVYAVRHRRDAYR
ncbi:MAG TPA: type II toxin-antitoxin system RelE/ParE family toxin [Chloroflexi bacterium]|nr:type II toxin-antitoxin system RelE/ParE family toxin [Chloroflexota bacterium]